MRYPDKFKGKKITTFYSYEDASGAEMYVVGRTEDKEFPIFHLNEHRHWVARAPKINIPFRLPQLVRADPQTTVYIVEGEKDVNTLLGAGCVATTCRGGANAWRSYEQWLDYFKGRKIVIIPDNDNAGRAYAKGVSEIIRPVALSLVVIELPCVKEKGDVSDWFAEQGGTPGMLFDLTITAIANERKAKLHETNGHAKAYEPGDAFEPAEDQLEEETKWDAGWKPFPLDVLPIEWNEYLSEVGRMLSVVPEYSLLSCVCTMGSALGNSRYINLNDEWPEPSVFWGCLIAENSTLKSPASDKAASPVLALRDEFVSFNREAREVFQAELHSWKNEPRRKPDDKEGPKDSPSPQRPRERRHRVEDITVERIAELLDDNPKGLFFYTDELESWFAMFTRYQTGGGGNPIRAFWLKAFNARSHDVDRKGGDRPTIAVSRAAVSLYGSTQHETLQGLVNSESFSSGLMARMLWCMPPRSKSVFVEGGMDPQIKLNYHKTFRLLYHIDGESVYDAGYRPLPTILSQSGLKAWKKFHGEWAEKQFGTFGKISGALKKLEAYCARFAMLYALIDWVNQRQFEPYVQAAHIDRAYRTVEWFAHEAARVYQMLSQDTLQLQEERLVAYIRDHEEGVTPNRIFLNNPDKWKRTQAVIDELERLIELGRLAKESCHAPGGRGFGKTVYKAI